MQSGRIPDLPEITSASNPRIRRLTALQTRARNRREEGLFVIEGLRLFLDTPPELLREIYVTESFLRRTESQTAGRIRTLAESAEIFLIPDRLMDKTALTETPQGVLCTASMPAEMQLLQEGPGRGRPGDKAAEPLYLLLEDLQDPGNLGTIFRTAEAAGVTGIIMSRGTTDVFSPKVVRATMSSIFRVPFLYTEDLPAVIRELNDTGILTCAAHLEGSVPYDEPDYRRGAAILIGNEGRGLREGTAREAAVRIRIPMEGQIESLNAAMAAGILLYEAHRQRNRGPGH